MLRLDPGEGRIRTARSFEVWEGGGEYNVVRALSSCFGMRTALVTAMVDNDIGRLIADLIRHGGVDDTQIRWVPHDGIGRIARNGLNFTERGFGVRPALGVSDRGHTAVSQLRPGEIDWDELFGRQGVRWLHTGGIFAALSSATADVAEEAICAAHHHGVVVSYDVNYRPSLWQDRGGIDAAVDVNRRLVKHVDVLIGNEGHLGGILGVGAQSADVEEICAATQSEFPHVSVIGATSRTAHSASRIDWGATVWSRTGLVRTVRYPDLDVFDRVGGGDGFVSGLIYGLLARDDLRAAADLGVAHGALAMTTPGDNSMASLAEVEALAAGVAISRR